MGKEFKTLEEAQAEIVRLGEELVKVTTERDNYSAKVTETNTELENVRKLNQQYFNKLSSQIFKDEDKDDKKDEDDAPTCEDFAKTLTI